ncbi:uncharacterized protein C8Q71DRAFT_795498 [Rhodofomes roseus]|uniref:Uncharacterized protein n=1 Tax=Rhodofomes roseus TaxID=34475 RepID=A0ABQ8KN56_9APHY|nr:uncharacterized protein C8Q71DRAFT_795498 [Rhodofomes roseus]KAH9839182.1 hypothetical protein C8Q71DRAFT_795498 [Rhodofomes roseus]
MTHHVPRTLVEYRMCALSAAIRDKPEWYNKFRNEAIRANWKEEIQEQQEVLIHRSQQLTDNMINYIFEELEAYVSLRDPDTGIQPGPYERIWQSDELISASLRAGLISAVAPLESVPDSEQDWHPGSDGKVLDLVHPSLYPVIYGRTISNTTRQPLKPRPSDINKMFISDHFQWLPSDFDVPKDGTVTLASPYINNIHPDRHRPLMDVIPRILEKAVPMFEWVLSELERKRPLPTRMDYQGNSIPRCIWPKEREPRPDDNTMHWFYAKHDSLTSVELNPFNAYYDKIADAAEYWLDSLPHIWPDSKPTYDGELADVKKTVSLRGRQLQVIVKLANIVLTPEKPVYEGGTWHVEGMDNEAIVSTFIYYYACENITESTLSFRTATHEPEYHAQYDYYCMNDEPCVQVVGRAVTKQHRCLAFPNLYQHLVSPFRLKDGTKSGHRKILVLFLVDPNVRVPSASDVGPQQAAWIRSALESTQLWQRLPTELQDIIWEQVDAVSDEEAKKYREELMKERTAFVHTVDGQRFGHPFSLWPLSDASRITSEH